MGGLGQQRLAGEELTAGPPAPATEGDPGRAEQQCAFTYEFLAFSRVLDT